MQAMIFAAGLGTRLRPLTDTMPKALVPVAGKPMLQHVVEKLRRSGFDELVINVHHFPEQIRQFLADNGNFDCRITISDESSALLDTGGGLQQAAALLRGSEPCLVHNVDILSNCDLAALMQAHSAGPSDDATLLVSRRPSSRQLLFDSEGRLRGWVNKLTGATKPAGFVYAEGQYGEYAFSGIQVVSARLREVLPEGTYSIIDYYLQHLDNLRIRAYPKEDLQLIDIGKPEILARATQFFADFCT